MKWRMLAFYAITLCFVVFFIGGIWKGIRLYQQYPNPQITTYLYGEAAQIGSYAVVIGDWQWDDGSGIAERFPEYNFYLPLIDERLAELRVGLITFHVTKNQEGDDRFAFPNVAFSSGAWSNQAEMELFFLLNSHLKSMTLDLAVGETEKVILPLVVMEHQFTQKQWQEVENREYYIDLQFYPEHVRFSFGKE